MGLPFDVAHPDRRIMCGSFARREQQGLEEMRAKFGAVKDNESCRRGSGARRGEYRGGAGAA